MSDCLWRIDGDHAELPTLGAAIDLARPELGVRGVLSPLHGVMGVRPAAPGARFALTDAYPRGADLVARYGPCEAFPFRTEVYWRADTRADAATTGLQMIVSVETDLLDTYPELHVSSRITPPGLATATDPGNGYAEATLDDYRLWCEAVHPTDLPEAAHEWRRQPSFEVSHWRLFARFLEKGVIRRARLAGALLPSGGAEAAAHWRQAFVDQPTPLTA